MKRHKEQILAQRYAIACVNLFSQQMHSDQIPLFFGTSDFLSEHRRILFFMQVPLIENNIKMDVLERVRSAFTLPEWCTRLFEILLAHKRAFLVAQVVRAIAIEYMKQQNIDLFSIASAYELNKNQQAQCAALLKEVSKKTILCEYTVNSSLIAGVRMQSSTALWEQSIQKQLRALHQRFVR